VKDDDPKLDQLLGGGYLGGPAYDRVLKRVLGQTAPTRLWQRPSWRLASLSVAAAVSFGAWLLVGKPGGAHFTPKGSLATGGSIEIGCAATGARSCRMGDTLLFTVNSGVSSGYLNAYAECDRDPEHKRIWYFPSAAGHAPFIAPGVGTVALEEGVKIGTEHAMGHCRVTVWLSSRLLRRDDIERESSRESRRSTLDLDLSE
jgi:hypothetical protein